MTGRSKVGSERQRKKTAEVIPPELRAVIDVPERAQILAVLQKRAMPASEYAEKYSLEELAVVARHFRNLEKHGWIKEVGKTKGGRGGPRPIYKAIKPSVVIDTRTWEKMSVSARTRFSQVILSDYWGRIAEALDAETFDAEKDRHCSWAPLDLDVPGWKCLIGKLDALLEWALDELQPQAEARMKLSGEKPIPTTLALAGFRSPSPSKYDGQPPQWVK
jgi:hypothetical protein